MCHRFFCTPVLSTTIWLGNLPQELDTGNLHRFLESFGALKQIMVNLIENWGISLYISLIYKILAIPVPPLPYFFHTLLILLFVFALQR